MQTMSLLSPSDEEIIQQERLFQLDFYIKKNPEDTILDDEVIIETYIQKNSEEYITYRLNNYAKNQNFTDPSFEDKEKFFRWKNQNSSNSTREQVEDYYIRNYAWYSKWAKDNLPLTKNTSTAASSIAYIGYHARYYWDKVFRKKQNENTLKHESMKKDSNHETK
jgi:hypothetical protein